MRIIKVLLAVIFTVIAARQAYAVDLKITGVISKKNSATTGNVVGTGELIMAKGEVFIGLRFYLQKKGEFDTPYNGYVQVNPTPPEAGKASVCTGTIPLVANGTWTSYFEVRYLDANGKPQSKESAGFDVIVPGPE